MTLTLVQGADSQREYEIEAEFQAMITDEKHGNHQQALWHAEKMRGLILSRSAEQIERMENARGLSD